MIFAISAASSTYCSYFGSRIVLIAFYECRRDCDSQTQFGASSGCIRNVLRPRTTRWRRSEARLPSRSRITVASAPLIRKNETRRPQPTPAPLTAIITSLRFAENADHQIDDVTTQFEHDPADSSQFLPRCGDRPPAHITAWVLVISRASLSEEFRAAARDAGVIPALAVNSICIVERLFLPAMIRKGPSDSPGWFCRC